jgi:hypothetical protein
VPYTVWLALACANPAPAQMPGGTTAGLNPVLTRLFGDAKAFTAKAQAEIKDSAGKMVVSTPMDFSYLNKKLRMDIDLEKVQSASQPAAVIATLKKMNMVQITTILRPDKKQVYVLWPGQKAALISPVAEGDTSISEGNSKITRTVLGKETLDGHPCTKHKVTIKDTQGNVTEATTWNASDLKDFPVQIQTGDKENVSTVRYSNVSLTAPAASKFEIPDGYQQYHSQQEMMQDLMKRLTPGDSAK